MKIYHNPRCSKSRETLQIILEAGGNPEIVDYLKNPISEEELQELVRLLGIKPSELVRRSEPEYQKNYSGKRLSEKQWIKALIKHPRLMERPIVVNGTQAVLGRPPEKVRKLL